MPRVDASADHPMTTLAGLAIAAFVLAAVPAVAAEPERLGFSARGDRHELQREALERVGPSPDGGLDICLTAPAQAALADFTAAHLGETVTVTIGPTVVTYVQLRKPYAGGCINWPIHPALAANYQAILTGKPAASSEGGVGSPDPRSEGPRN